MHKYLEIYYFIDRFDFKELSEIKKKINIIFRDYNRKIEENEILKTKYFCKKKGFNLFLANNIKLNGFLKSIGIHEFEVPHFYMIEHRDPYAGSADPQHKDFRYDSALAQANPIFAYNIEQEEMQVIRIKASPWCNGLVCQWKICLE